MEHSFIPNSHFFNAKSNLRFPVCSFTELSLSDLTLLIDSKVELNDYIGIIRYIGKLLHEVSKDDEIWAGIEWEDTTRGKHNGTVGGYEYFKTHNGAHSGSLVKLSKLNFGQTFLQAVKFKYNFYSNDKNGIHQFLDKAIESELFIQAKNKKIQIELVGKEKAIKRFSDLDNMEQIDLTCSYVKEIDVELITVLPKLREVILTKTLLTHWSSLVKLISNLPHVELINFSDNQLHFDNEYDNLVSKTSNNKLKYLVLNKCHIDLTALIKLSPLLKNLDYLYLRENSVNENSYEDSKVLIEDNKMSLWFHLENLKFLSLEQNSIKNISFIYEVLSLKSLVGLNLNHNHLTELKSNPQAFKLSTLYIDYNFLSNSEDILRQISFYENLIDLDILNNNFAQKLGIEKMTTEIVGRLSKLETLNNTTISKLMRKEYELEYLKNSVSAYFKLNPSLTKETFKEENFTSFIKINHPSYLLLRKKYYDPLEDALENLKKSQSNTIKGNMVEVTFKYSTNQIVKKIPKSTTFSNLRNLLIKLLKITGPFNFYRVFNTEDEIITDETSPIGDDNLIILK